MFTDRNENNNLEIVIIFQFASIVFQDYILFLGTVIIKTKSLSVEVYQQIIALLLANSCFPNKVRTLRNEGL